MEIASIFVINKSDHPGAARLEQELRAEGYHCPIVHTIATEGKGIEALLNHIDSVTQAPGPHAPATVPRVSLHVTGLSAVLEQLQASGVRVQTGENGHPYLMIDASTGGVLLELIQEQQ